MKIITEETDAVAVMDFLEEGILMHVVNDQGVMGAGIARTIAYTWPEVELEYTNLYAIKNGNSTKLRRKVLFSKVNNNPRFIVANMFAQRNISGFNRPSGIPLQYDWLEPCLRTVFGYAVENNLDVRNPKIGAGLAGGDWDIIWPMIRRVAEEANFTGTLTLHIFVPK